MHHKRGSDMIAGRISSGVGRQARVESHQAWVGRRGSDLIKRGSGHQFNPVCGMSHTKRSPENLETTLLLSLSSSRNPLHSICKSDSNMRRAIELRLRPPNVNGISADPQPDWSFDELISELNSIDFGSPSPFSKIESRDLKVSKQKRSFVMHVSDHEINSIDSDSDSDSDVEAGNSRVVSGRRFASDEIYMRDLKVSKQKRRFDSEAGNSCVVSDRRFASDEIYMSSDGITLGMQCNQLMDKVRLAEGAVHELTNEFRLCITEEVRSKISSLETELVNENEKFALLTTKIDKDREPQQEKERKLDLQYQRTIAEALDNHLTAVQRDHEHISQLEERITRDDMARAEAKRTEKAIQEEKLWQERIRTEEEARLKVEMAERAIAATIETEKKAAKEAAGKRASDTLNTAHNAGKDSKEAPRLSISTFDVRKGIQSSVRNIIQASENALESEKRRQHIYEELSAKNKTLKESANQDYQSQEKNIARLIRTVQASSEAIRTKAEELAKLINSPEYSQSISIKSFAEKIVYRFSIQRSTGIIFAASRVIALVIYKIPLAVDILIAELNRVCIYTVPKHISYSEEAFRTKDDYFKAIGYREVDGKIEGVGDYIARLRCYMKLYGALLVQAEVGGSHNRHGLAEGWAWLARFLNTLPANLFTANALDSFLEMAGYTLHRQYKNQFEKLLRVITRDFLSALQDGDNATKIAQVKSSIQGYVNLKHYKEIPDGFNLRTRLDSHMHVMTEEELRLHNIYHQSAKVY